MEFKLCDFGEFTDELNALMFTFKTKSFICLYLKGLKKQNSVTSWWEGRGVDCDQKNQQQPFVF